MSTSAAYIPIFYRILFTYFDPFIAGAGGLLQFFSPLTSLTSFVANPPAVPPAFEPIFEQNGAGALNVAFLSAVLLRVSPDLKVWKALQGGLLIMDFCTAYTLRKSLDQQGRLAMADWRAEEWQWIVPIIFLTLSRSAFIAGIGLRGNGAKASAKRA